MLLSPVRVARPELRDDVQRLIAELHNSPEVAELEIVELVRLLGVQVAPAFHEQLEARGAIRLGTHQFENVGAPIRRRVRLGGIEMALSVGARLAGTVSRTSDGLRLEFEREHTVSLSKLMLKARLCSLGVHTDHIDARLLGGAGLRIDLV